MEKEGYEKACVGGRKKNAKRMNEAARLKSRKSKRPMRGEGDEKKGGERCY